jgi:hypothetical protein
MEVLFFSAMEVLDRSFARRTSPARRCNEQPHSSRAVAATPLIS